MAMGLPGIQEAMKNASTDCVYQKEKSTFPSRGDRARGPIFFTSPPRYAVLLGRQFPPIGGVDPGHCRLAARPWPLDMRRCFVGARKRSAAGTANGLGRTDMASPETGQIETDARSS